MKKKTEKGVGERLIIAPEGWINVLNFETGKWRCGEEVSGIHVDVRKSANIETAGGVLKRTDMVKLIKMFKDHLKKYPL